jgi:hypothetical protein
MMTAKPPVKAIIEPSERSMPPNRITKIEPQDIMPIVETDQRTLEIFLDVGKLWGAITVRIIKNPIRINNF